MGFTWNNGVERRTDCITRANGAIRQFVVDKRRGLCVAKTARHENAVGSSNLLAKRQWYGCCIRRKPPGRNTIPAKPGTFKRRWRAAPPRGEHWATKRGATPWWPRCGPTTGIVNVAFHAQQPTPANRFTTMFHNAPPATVWSNAVKPF